MMAERAGAESQRIDQWLWYARLVKSRTLAQALITRGKVRINRSRIEKTSQVVKADDIVTISLGPKVRVVKIVAFGLRRGPASEAARLYLELTPNDEVTKSRSIGAGGSRSVTAAPQAVRERGSGRPTKRDRRDIERLKG